MRKSSLSASILAYRPGPTSCMNMLGSDRTIPAPVFEPVVSEVFQQHIRVRRAWQGPPYHTDFAGRGQCPVKVRRRLHCFSVPWVGRGPHVGTRDVPCLYGASSAAARASKNRLPLGTACGRRSAFHRSPRRAACVLHEFLSEPCGARVPRTCWSSPSIQFLNVTACLWVGDLS
jgi:hypothetical protein